MSPKHGCGCSSGTHRRSGSTCSATRAYVLHAFPCVDVDDEFFITGEAIPLVDAAMEATIRVSLPFNSDAEDRPFELSIDRALLATYAGRPSWPPVYSRWRAS